MLTLFFGNTGKRNKDTPGTLATQHPEFHDENIVVHLPVRIQSAAYWQNLAAFRVTLMELGRQLLGKYYRLDSPTAFLDDMSLITLPGPFAYVYGSSHLQPSTYFVMQIRTASL